MKNNMFLTSMLQKVAMFSASLEKKMQDIICKSALSHRQHNIADIYLTNIFTDR